MVVKPIAPHMPAGELVTREDAVRMQSPAVQAINYLIQALSDPRMPTAHQLDGDLHTASGLTAGYFLKATSPTSFGFAAHGLTYSDVGAAAASHTQAASTISDSTTVGRALLTLANPGAIAFPRINGDNSVTARSASELRSDIGAGTSSITDHTALSNIGTNAHTTIDTHLASTSNPHAVTKTQVGLGNVTNDAQAKAGAITTSGLTMNTAKVLGRSTAGSGAVEEISVATACGPSTVPISDTSARIKANNTVDAARDLLIANVSGGYSNGARVALKRNNITMGYVDGDYFYGLRFGTTDAANGEAVEVGGFRTDGKFYVLQLTASQAVVTDASKNLTSLAYSSTGAANALMKTNGALTAGRAMATNSSGEPTSLSAAVTAKLTGVVALTNANEWYNGPEVSLEAGTWIVFGTSFIEGGSNSGRCLLKITTSSGNTSTSQTYGTACGRVTSGAGQGSISVVSEPITVASTTTVRLQASCETTGTEMKYTTGSGQNNLTQITAMRLY